ncbi:cellulase [Opitutaceae bacterium TAV5]|nr:cellulase [Opitutaceae bacterium TAV5]
MNLLDTLKHPLAITMWDFSWLERRWPGAGYEDRDKALDGLVERGYDAVRIDAYPHLVAADPHREWEILPPWNQQDWGSPARVHVRVMPALTEFICKCRERGLRVALSTWFQNDTTERRLGIASARVHAAIWIATLEQIERAGLLDAVLYVDICNEWPGRSWAPFFPEQGNDWRTPASFDWMRECCRLLRERYPALPLTTSFSTFLSGEDLRDANPDFLDFLEPHRWMSFATDFYERVGYHFERFESIGYENVVARAERLYRSDPEYWKGLFARELDALVDWSRATGKPLVTTEGWAIVDYKDWPGLDWGWVKELNAWAVERVVASGRWAAICTSNFCGPQFRGMWRDVDWHRNLTRKIHAGKLPS